MENKQEVTKIMSFCKNAEKITKCTHLINVLYHMAIQDVLKCEIISCDIHCHSICITERQEERLKNNNRDLSMVG